MDSLKRAEVKRQIFNAIGAAVVKINTRGHLRGFAGHFRQLIQPGQFSSIRRGVLCSQHPCFRYRKNEFTKSLTQRLHVFNGGENESMIS